VTLAELAAGCLILGTPSLSLLSWPGIVWIGRMSYGWYLWHYPVIRVVRSLGVHAPLHVLAIGGGVSLALAALSYYTVERYFRASRAPGMELRPA
jgi:peptidoglycan/LPS O-acetylase OafA/YrhL